MSSVARSQSRYQGNQFGRRTARSVNLCTVVASLALLASVFAVQAGSVTATIYVGSHFEIRDHGQPTKYVFNGSTRVAEITGSLSSNLRVQRLRLYPGWNLCSLAVSGPFPASGAEAISAAYQWNSGTGDYSQITLGQSLAAGTVLWIRAGTNADVSVLGTYSDPTAQQVQAGGTYVSGAGLEAWSPALPDSASGWEFEPGAVQWSDHLAGDLAAISGPSPVLSPGEAFYLQAAAPVSLDIPDPTLRLRYYHQDHLGSSAAITDAQGTLIEESEFYAFGALRNRVQLRQVEEPFQYTQKERDRESRLDYFGARYYVPVLNRWPSCDPGGAVDGLNPYLYSRNNPIRFVDPAGFDSWDPTFVKSFAAMNGCDAEGFDWKTLAATGGSVGQAIMSGCNAARQNDSRKDSTASALAGFGDNLIGWLVDTRKMREDYGIQNVDENSGVYTAGQFAGCGANLAIGAKASAAENTGPLDVVPPSAGTVQTVLTEAGQGVAVGARVGGKGASIIAVAQTGEHSASGILGEAAYQADAARKMEYVNKRTVELAPQRTAAMEGYLTGDPNFPKGAGPIIKMIADEADIIFGTRSR
jgi:RHS repeat-associated protein